MRFSWLPARMIAPVHEREAGVMPNNLSLGSRGARRERAYRLPSEAEMGIMLRAEGTQTKYWWGPTSLNRSWPIARIALTSAARRANPIKGPGVLGQIRLGCMIMGWRRVDQWVEDCWHKNYQGAPSDRFTGGRGRTVCSHVHSVWVLEE